MNSGKRLKKDNLYDDRLPGIRWRFPHQCAHWFGMTRSDDAPNSKFTAPQNDTERAGQKRLHISCARLGRPPCGQIPIYRTTRRYRAVPKGETITHHVRHGLAAGTASHDLAARPAGKFQYVCLRGIAHIISRSAFTYFVFIPGGVLI